MKNRTVKLRILGAGEPEASMRVAAAADAFASRHRIKQGEFPAMTSLTIDLSRELCEALDRFAAEAGQTMSREQAAAVALNEWAAGRGLLPSGQPDIRPEDLNASNDD